MATFLHDLRYGIRTLTAVPGFTAIAIAVLALGIGVNATVFSLANTLFLRPLPAADPDALVRVYSNRVSNTGYRAYTALRDRNATLSGLAGFQGQSFGILFDAVTEHAFGEVSSGNYFSVLGLTPAAGRLIAPDDDRPGAAPVVVLAHAFWTRRFAADRGVVGRSLTLNGQPFTIIGVAPHGFTGVLAPLAGDLWVPLSSDAVLRPALDEAARLNTVNLHLIGRLKPGVRREQAQADLDAIGQQLRRADGQPERAQRAVTVYGGTMLHPEASRPVTIFTAVLMAVVGMVLLIVCVNVANLVLARAAGRQAEFAVRQSLGAGRGRLVRQLLTENALLAAAGAIGGFTVAVWATRTLMAVRIPAPVPLIMDLSVDWRVLAFTTALAAGATLAFGLVPALAASRIDLVGALKGHTASARHSRLRSSFLVAQVSLSVVLLIVAGLFIRSFRSAHSIPRGFDTDGVVTASIDLQMRGYSEPRGQQFIRDLRERLTATPGIMSANLVDIVPMTLSNRTTRLRRDEDPAPSPGQPPVTPLIYVNAVGPGHFATLGIGMLGGRDFTDRDTADAAGVAIVNDTFARTFWPGEPAIGKRLRPLGPEADRRGDLEVIAVVRDSKYITIGEEPMPFLYRPLAQAYVPRLTLLVRTAGSSTAAVAAVRRAVGDLDAGLPVFNVATLSDATAISLLPARIAGDLLGALGIFALLLAALGIYGVLSFLVRSRTREIGVRLALGASPRGVIGMVLRQALFWTGGGAAIGLVLAVGLTRLVSSLLYGVSPTDALTFGSVVVLLAAVAALAAFLPALRASRVDPLVALRDL